ncbi:MAG: hopanoid C-3 methylase HpnR [Elusimicrobia bacterium]|nr:hopanoid C-3 methylase HpnR [Elusimicrobiota bacterium]
MKVLLVHPGCLMHSEIYLRLEPLGLELVAEALRRASHEVRLIDMQVSAGSEFLRQLQAFAPDAVGFSLNYLANVPEVLDLACAARRRLPRSFLFCGGHSASFIPAQLLAHEPGVLDCVIRGEGEESAGAALEAVERGEGLLRVPGAVTPSGWGPPPRLLRRLGEFPPARDLSRLRRRYFIGSLDPCACVEFSRGCPWDCSFCSAWTFYGRTYRLVDPERAAQDLAAVREPSVFVADDVAFADAAHGMELARHVRRLGIRKQYYLETRADVLLRNSEVFRAWRRLGLSYLFLGLESIDEAGLRAHRKRTSLGRNEEALAFARSLDVNVAVNIIADPGWDERRFAAVREWARSVPEIVHLTVNTPYPGTENWLQERRPLTTRDYRLFDVQHAVFPTRLPLRRFYEELVATQEVLNRKHLGWRALQGAAATAARCLARGQTNFVRMLWKFNGVYNPARQAADHDRPVRYELEPPPEPAEFRREDLYLHAGPAGGNQTASAGSGTASGTARADLL